MFRHSPFILLSVAGLLAANAAGAQTAPQPPRVACRSSVMTLCPDEVKAMDKEAIKACLIKNYDKATPECQASLKAAAAKSAPPPAH